MPYPDIDYRRARRIFAEGKTQWRAYLNLHAEKINLVEPVLDIGSGEFGTASYQRFIPGYAELDVQSVDLDPARRPSKVADLNDGIPYADEQFNTVLAFGVLEYLYDFEFVLRDVHRVLGAGGYFHIAVPFLDRVASDGGDAFRFTARALEQMLQNTGYTEIEITAYGHGAYTAALDQIEFSLPRPLRGLVYRACVGIDKLLTKRSGGRFRNQHDYPLGYMLSARKP